MIKRIIARLDAKENKLIKGINLEGWKIIGELEKYAKKYYSQGADELLIIDSVASLYDRDKINEIIKVITKNVFIPITVGGGVRSFKDAVDLFMSGADKIAINSAAILQPNIINKLAKNFGSQSVVSSIQAKKIGEKKWTSYYESARENSNLDVIEWAKKCESFGAGEILITSVDKDGTESGYDESLAEEISKNIKIPIILSGGFGKTNDIIKINKKSNIDAFAIGTTLHKDKLNIRKIKKELNKLKLKIRKNDL